MSLVCVSSLFGWLNASDSGAAQYLLYNRAGAESFLETKKSQRHNSTKIIGPCQYVYEKSVGPVGAMTIGHSLIQLRSGDAVSSQLVQGRSLVGVQGAKPPEAPKILYFTLSKWSKTARLFVFLSFWAELFHPA